jgi:hypothetical protein
MRENVAKSHDPPTTGAAAMKGKVTIRDVAVMAQVSNQTVSRVINNRPDAAREIKNFPTFAAAIPNLPPTNCVQGRLKGSSGPFQRSATVKARSGVSFLKYLSPSFISPYMQTLPSVSAAAVDNSVAG